MTITTLIDWVRLTRWGEWVQSKLPFLAAVTVLLAPSETSAPQVLAIVATVAAGAAFGYGLNDVADRASDARAGTLNRAAGTGRGTWLPYLVVTGGGALGLSVVWAPDAAAPVLVAVGLVLAAAYSVPPLRLKERGLAGVAGAAAAQWGIPALVVSAVESDGWLRTSAWSLALLSLAIGTRWMLVHELQDVSRDRASGVRTYASGRHGASGLLSGVFACELVLLAIALASTLPRSALAAIVLVPYLVQATVLLARHRHLFVRLAGYDHAPLATYYFLALPVAVAVRDLVAGSGSAAVPGLLLILALPQLLARLRYWRGDAGSAVNRAMASTHRPVVSASEPQP